MTLPPTLRRMAADYSARYQLGVPANIRLDRIMAMQPALLRGLADWLGALIGAARNSESPLHDAGVAVREHWSNHTAATYLEQLRGRAAALGGELAPLHSVTQELAGTVAQQQQAAGAATASAAAAADWSSFETTHTPEWERRFAIAGGMVRAIAAADDLVRAVLGRFLHALAAVPARNTSVPTMSPLAPAPAPTAADQLDRRLRGVLECDLADPDPTVRAVAAGVQQALQRAQLHGGSAQLLVYDPRAFGGQGRAAISIGNADLADQVAVLVPGSASSVTDMSGSVDAGGELLAQVRSLDAEGQSAVVVWSGYDFPWSVPAGSRDYLSEAGELFSAVAAADGGKRLSDELQLISTIARQSARVVLVGHSMGGVVVSEALTSRRRVDAAVLLGAPGAGGQVASARDYSAVEPQRIFVLAHSADVITMPLTDAAATSATAVADPYGPGPERHRFDAEHVDITSAHSVLQPNLLAHHMITNYLRGQPGQQVARVVVGRTAEIPRRAGRK